MLEFRALVLSVTIEALVVAGIGRRWDWGWAAVGVTCVTHPFAWQGFGLVEEWGFWERSLLIEGVVVLVEALLYRWVLALEWRTCWGLSIGANGMSYGLGLWLLRM
jgi:hypothetical protein